MEKNKTKNFSKKDILKLSTVGIIAGIISGLFSTGGGMILVPAFIYLLELDNTKARGTSVFCILPMVATSSFFYYKENYIVEFYDLAGNVWEWTLEKSTRTDYPSKQKRPHCDIM